MLPDYLVVDPTSPTGLRYSKNRGKRHERKFKYVGEAIEWVRATREEIHDDKFLRHR